MHSPVGWCRLFVSICIGLGIIPRSVKKFSKIFSVALKSQFRRMANFVLFLLSSGLLNLVPRLVGSLGAVMDCRGSLLNGFDVSAKFFNAPFKLLSSFLEGCKAISHSHFCDLSSIRR